ncbi:MAG: hypothetical protein WB239_00005, partial [Acidimicrobiia bacterium]
GAGLLIAGTLARPFAIAILTGLLVVARWVFGSLGRRAKEPEVRRLYRLATSALSTLVVGAVIVADGGTESPLFFWMLIVLAWQALLFERRDLLILDGVAAATYLVVIIAANDVSATSIARFALLLAFMLVLYSGRTVLDGYRARVRHMDAMIATLVQDLPIAVAVFDSDRETVLYANTVAEEMGLDDRDAMTRLVPTDPSLRRGAGTLGESIHFRAWEPLPPRTYQPLGSDRLFRVGARPERLGDGTAILVVYGEDIGPAH